MSSLKNLKLKVSANGRYFVDQQSKPFFYLGDTCWLLFQRPNGEEVDEYLKDRAAKGFTVIQAYVVRGLGKQHPDGNSSLLDATPFIDRDPARPKPTVDMEPAYENHPTGVDKPRVDSHKVRTQAYLAMLAGAAVHGYGSLDLFYFYKDADGPFPKNGFQHWRTAMAYEGSRQVGLRRRLFEERPWYKMVPDQSVLAFEPGSGPFRLAAARADDRSFAISYTPVGQPLSIHLDKLNGPEIKAGRYDPRTGTRIAVGQDPNDGIREFTPPPRGPKNDWVLVLDALP